MRGKTLVPVKCISLIYIWCQIAGYLHNTGIGRLADHHGIIHRTTLRKTMRERERDKNYVIHLDDVTI